MGGKMKRVTRNNLIRLVEMKRKYEETEDEQLVTKINEYIENIINKDKRYYHKLLSYQFDNETIKYLM